MTLSANDVRRVLDFVGEAHGAGDLDELRRFLPVGLSELIRTDYASYNEVGNDGTVYATVVHPELEEPMHDDWGATRTRTR